MASIEQLDQSEGVEWNLADLKSQRPNFARIQKAVASVGAQQPTQKN
jgi:hypothetical protein